MPKNFVSYENAEDLIESVASHIDDRVTWEANSVLGAKNLIPYPYYNTTKTENGITFTDNGDGTVTANGTASADANFYCQSRIYNSFSVDDNDYIFNGCPNDGSTSKYVLILSKGTPSAWISDVIDIGEGVNITIDSNYIYYCVIKIKSGQTVENLIFKPMLRLAEDTDSEYQPYAKTNKKLTIDKAEQKEVDDISNVYGAKNLIPYPYYTVDGVYNDITFSTDEDGRINVSGTASANTNISLISNNDNSNWIYLQDGITYKFICSEPYDGTEFNIIARAYHSDGTYKGLTPGQTYTAVEGDIVKYCTIWVSKDVTIRTSTNVEVMICVASIKDETYHPYAMTNKQLTDNVKGIDIDWSDYVNLTDVQRSNNHYIIHNAPKSGITAADITYDNATSGLTSTDVNDAIDEVAGRTASDISYSNTTSELSSTNVKGAIDELAKPAFTEASTRSNISTGEKLSTILGKIKKFFTDLKTVAFTGSYDDLSGRITYLGEATLNQVGGFGGTLSYMGSMVSPDIKTTSKMFVQLKEVNATNVAFNIVAYLDSILVDPDLGGMANINVIATAVASTSFGSSATIKVDMFLVP